MKFIKKILFLLSPREIKSVIYLLVIMVIMAFLEIVGIVSILPFITVLSNPSLIETNTILNLIYKASSVIGVENHRHFLIVLGAIVLILLVISLSFKAFTIYLQVRFNEMRIFSISKNLLERYLHQPYSWFLSRNSADFSKTILSEVEKVVGNGISPLLNIISQGMVTIAIITLLAIINPILTLIITFLFGFAYLGIYKFSKIFIHQIGEQNLEYNLARFLSTSEAFGAIKQVKVTGSEQIYLDRFSLAAYKYSKTNTYIGIISALPRYAIEITTFSIIIFIILILMSKTDNFNDILPIISVYVYAGYRLIPAFQVLYGSLAKITFGMPSLNKLCDDLKNIERFDLKEYKNKVPLNTTITLENIYYNYPNQTKSVLENLSLTIPVKTKVGIIGTTGSGKTTIVDIILGLLEPQKGILKIDNQIINQKNIKAWTQSLGYVPQNIYLADDTIAANIAFGVDQKKINKDQLTKVSKIANLHDFITQELPKKYQTIVGERGVRLSGGQCQRIGIARALYHNPKVLIFDEATSALDKETEKSVMDAIRNISEDITIIMIAHRLNTLKDCDTIFKFENGKLVSEENFDQMMKKNSN